MRQGGTELVIGADGGKMDVQLQLQQTHLRGEGDEGLENFHIIPYYSTRVVIGFEASGSRIQLLV